MQDLCQRMNADFLAIRCQVFDTLRQSFVSLRQGFVCRPLWWRMGERPPLAALEVALEQRWVDGEQSPVLIAETLAPLLLLKTQRRQIDLCAPCARLALQPGDIRIIQG